MKFGLSRNKLIPNALLNEEYFLTCGFKCLKQIKRRHYTREGGILLSHCSSARLQLSQVQSGVLPDLSRGATRDLIYDILKPSGAWFQPNAPQSRFSKGPKNYSSCIFRLQQRLNAPTTVYYLAQISMSATSVHSPEKTHMLTNRRIRPSDRMETVLKNMWSGVEVVRLKRGLMNS